MRAGTRVACRAGLQPRLGGEQRGQHAGMARVSTADSGGATHDGPAIRHNQIDTKTRGVAVLAK
jgi:hypothetical protein